MSDKNLDYRRGYTELVRLCAMMLMALTETESREDDTRPVLTTERAENLRDECARLLNLFVAQEQFDVDKHDAIMHRMMAIFTEINGNDSNAWLTYQPALQQLHKHLN
ncbi:hypothetical protein QZP90_26360 [Serratia marcescens]|jgi:uncharacterized protein Smg (DUF494 family)|uniref:hypothetical protein n=1 Tax=Serratia TaxID=613 RepID=UPI000F8CF4E9|nr:MULTISPECIES: hypothetical protein [Serratia]MBH3245143.1 hypothetical protein [Serratia marcescens]MBN5413948.1 hypothetical protein [Serratia marcescens]MDP8737044.1 hypothetical protein [Serratia marcescens]MDU4176566.1 hypothetical protein [Serratia liquefaciens]QDI35790.1 hypothetical protein FG170_26120 [Serratia marcescens]